ncbi:MAG: hypothetical protein OEY03_02050 [Rhizobacter sp.]|nr:hypothetical protein [Rhizobacter sp.]
MQLSRDLDHHLFDTLDHAVALASKDALPITADARYLAKASSSGPIFGTRAMDLGRLKRL